MLKDGYVAKKWTAGDVITAPALNALEEGVQDIVLVNTEDPNKDYNKVWIKPTTDCFEIPTYEELEIINKTLGIIQTFWIRGSLYESNGEFFDSTYRIATDFIEISSNMLYSLNFNTNDFNIRIFEYAEDKSYIKNQYIQQYTNNTKIFNNLIKLTDNTKYIRLTIFYPSDASIVSINEGYTFLLYKNTNTIFPTQNDKYSFLRQTQSANGIGYDSTTRVTSFGIPIEAGLYEITVPSNMYLMIYDGELYGGNFNRTIFGTSISKTINITIQYIDNSFITPADVYNKLNIKPYEPIELQNIENIAIHSLNNYVPIRINGILYRASEIYKMPKSGINLEQVNLNSNTPTHSCMFFNMENNYLIPATEYEYSNIKWNEDIPSFLMTKNSIFYPYNDNLYFCAIFNYSGGEPKIPDNLYIAYGEKKENYSRLTNLSTLSIKNGINPSPNEEIVGYYPSFTLWNGDGYITEQYFYGAVLRLQDVKSICCSADLSMCCWWYDESGILIDKIVGTSLSSYKVTGINYINLSAYGTNGYCVIAIRAPFTAKSPDSTATVTTFNEETMGGLHLRDYIFNHVFVEYYNKTIISYSNGMNPKLAHNIDTYKNLNFGNIFSFKYGGPVTANRLNMDSMKNANSVFYGGAAYVNSLFQNVSLKSYTTACKNPNSRIYISDWTNGKISTNYGMVCNNLPAVLYGIKWMARVASWYQTTINYPGFTIKHNFNIYDDFNEIIPGDWLVGENEEDQDAHIILVTNIIYINGAIFAIEGMESYPPMVRYRYLYLDSMLDNFNLEFARKEPIGTFYNMLIHVNPNLIKPLEESFGPISTEYEVGTLMCDRGTDSVYTSHMSHCYITINDTEITSFDIYKDNEKINTIFIDSSILINFDDHELQAIDIMSIIANNGAGYYTLIPNNQTVVQESFYVAPDQSIDTNMTEQDVMLTLSNPIDFVYLVANYKPSTGIIPERENFRVRITYLPDRLNNNVITFPKNVSYLNDNYEYDWCEVIYNTPYGTYMVRRDEENELTYISSDSTWDNGIPD